MASGAPLRKANSASVIASGFSGSSGARLNAHAPLASSVAFLRVT